MTRLGPERRVLVDVSAKSGSLVRDRSLTLSGDVRLKWHGASALGSFRCPSLRWTAADGTIRSVALVRGTLSGLEGDEGAPGTMVELAGVGLELSESGSRGRVARDVLVTVSDDRHGPWIISADGGVVFETRGRAVALRFAGPVMARGRTLTWSADAAEVHLRSMRSGGLRLERGWGSGSVSARGRIQGGFEPGGSFVEGAFEGSAGAAELTRSGAMILQGTPQEPAALTFARGRLRGIRIELTRRCARSEGGATSAFEWGTRR
jgi:hypothetical protein